MTNHNTDHDMPLIPGTLAHFIANASDQESQKFFEMTEAERREIGAKVYEVAVTTEELN